MCGRRPARHRHGRLTTGHPKITDGHLRTPSPSHLPGFTLIAIDLGYSLLKDYRVFEQYLPVLLTTNVSRRKESLPPYRVQQLTPSIEKRVAPN